MPPVRWKLFIAVILACLTQEIAQANLIHDTIPMASDGWRPIIGTSQRDVEEEITLYRNPTQTDENSEPVKAQPIPVYTPAPTLATKPYQTISTSQATVSSVIGSNSIHPGSIKPQAVGSNSITPGSIKPQAIGSNSIIPGNIKPQVFKTPPHSKARLPFLLMSNQHGHGPHIPLTSSGNKGIPRRRPVKNKPQLLSGKRHVKPVRGSAIAHSMKHEVYVPAPSAAIGTFTFYNQALGPKPQGGKHFQPQFASQFGFSGISGSPNANDVIIQQVPVQTFFVQNRNPIQNDNLFVNQNDEYTRNLVPPPYTKQYQQEKEKQKVFKPKEQSSGVTVTEQSANINNPQLIIGKPKEPTRHRTVVPENIIVQLPPPFNQQTQFGSNFNQQSTKDPVEVHVTKEKLKVFHNSVPSNYNVNEESYEQQYNFQNANKPIEQQKLYTFESFPVIKNQKQTFRKPTEAYPVFEEPKQKPVSEAPSFPTYDVTEGKQWQGFQPFLSTRPSVMAQEALSPQPPPRMQPQPMEFIFLPTPYTGDGSVQTSPTQSEISSIYAELNRRNRPPAHDYSTLDPNFFSIKEVSTHYPIVGRPESPALFSIPDTPPNTEFSNEITTMKEEKPEPFQIYQPVEETEPTVPPTRPAPVRDWQGQRQRPHQRRRRPTHRTRTTTTATTTTSTTTTTEEPAPVTETYEVHKVHSSEENYSGETQRPQRRRRPTRVRTTEVPPETTKAEEVTRPTVRQRFRSRTRPTASAEVIEEMPSNHKMTEAVSYSGGMVQPVQESVVGSEVVNRFRQQHTTEEVPGNEVVNRFRQQHTTEELPRSELVNRFRQQHTTEEVPVIFENEVAKTERKPEILLTENYPNLSFGKHYHPIESEEETQKTEKQPEIQTEPSSSEEVVTHSRRRIPQRTTTTSTTTTTEHQPVSNILTPENEVDYDYSTQPNHFEPSKETITIQEVYNKIPESDKNEATLATTTSSTTTSTTETSTTKSHRMRRPVNKYDNRNRPRFSVKEYRQRLSQYSSTTAEPIRSSTTESSRMRFSNRSRKPIALIQEEEPTTERSKFTPKDPRHGATSSNGNEATVPEKKVNTRLRPFGRYRTTTEASTTQKISIKPNIFSNLRRPPMVSLRTRIMNKYNRTNTVLDNMVEKSTEKPNEVESGSESSEAVETTIIYNVPSDSTTESDVKKQEEESQENETINDEIEHEDMANKEIMKNDPFMQSQRVVDLTLASQKEYETPGLFKSVSPNTRIVPSYFTISTDDPILPIEAFFPNLNKNSRSDS